MRTLALMVVLSTAGAAIVDYPVQAEAARPEDSATRAELLQFFAMFYTAMQVVTFIAQTAAARAVRRLGLGRTIRRCRPASASPVRLALLFPTFSMFAIARGIESVLRGSLFRSGYELLFVPMEPDEKRRTKTFLDVTCDRAGDAVGAVIVQLAAVHAVAFQQNELLAVAIVLAGAAGLGWHAGSTSCTSAWSQRRLVQHGERTPIVVGSETGWTVIELPAAHTCRHGGSACRSSHRRCRGSTIRD